MEFPCHDINKCTNCKACIVSCPFDAITTKQNQYGEEIPFIIKDRCKKCNICQKICPMNKEQNLMPIKACYAGVAKDKQIYETTSSGGAATVFSEYILKKGGIVYGAAYTDNVVKHIRVDNFQKLGLLKGSKYVQSNVGTCYKLVKEDLHSGIKVLFIGTPCQVQGLKSFLNSEYDNLITVDLICHGTPPISYLRAYINDSCGIDDISKVTFRAKERKLSVYNKKKLIYSRINVEDYYFTAFAKSLIFRENCYNCDFAQSKRCSDITIGDFWGIADTALNFANRSVVLIISDKGQAFWDKCQSEFYYEEHCIDEAVKGNSQLQHASMRPKARDKFLKAYVKKGFMAGIKASGIKIEVDLMRLKHFVCKKNK